MNTVSAGIIVVVIVIAGIIGVVLISGFMSSAQQRTKHCDEWSMEIERRRAELSGEFFQTDQEWAVFNQQVAEYNSQCA
jgi:hypothetical protein